jgi:hypothetical protein
LIGFLAEVFNWPPSELDDLTAAKLRFWVERANETVKRRSRR